jgi:hypothetical protein
MPATTIRFAVTPEHLLAGQRTIARGLTWSRWILTAVSVIICILIVGSTLVLGRPLGEVIRRTWSLTIAVPVFWIFGFPFMQRYFIYRVWKSAPAFRGEHEYTVAANGITVTTAVARAELAWSAITGAGEDDEFVFLHMGKALPHVLPKSAFRGPDAVSDFRDTVTAAIGPRARWT